MLLVHDKDNLFNYHRTPGVVSIPVPTADPRWSSLFQISHRSGNLFCSGTQQSSTDCSILCELEDYIDRFAVVKDTFAHPVSGDRIWRVDCGWDPNGLLYASGYGQWS